MIYKQGCHKIWNPEKNWNNLKLDNLGLENREKP